MTNSARAPGPYEEGTLSDRGIVASPISHKGHQRAQSALDNSSYVAVHYPLLSSRRRALAIHPFMSDNSSKKMAGITPILLSWVLRLTSWLIVRLVQPRYLLHIVFQIPSSISFLSSIGFLECFWSLLNWGKTDLSSFCTHNQSIGPSWILESIHASSSSHVSTCHLLTNAC